MDFNKIVKNIVDDPKNIKMDKELKKDTKESLKRFRNQGLEDEYRKTTLESYKNESNN